MSLLDNGPLPLWLFIVIIVVGSLVIVGAVVTAVYCLRIRHKAKQTEEDEEDEEDAENGPTRKVTLRRGRLVPTDDYMSLTGSQFGLSNLLNGDDADSTPVRSKSPFEWWNSLKERSISRQSMSEVESNRSNPALGLGFYRREFATSTASLASSRDKESSTETREIEQPKWQSSPRANRTPNFSRTFLRAPPPAFAKNSTLSRIEEASPHHSMISSISSQPRFSAVHRHSRSASGGSHRLSHLTAPSRTSLHDPSTSSQTPTLSSQTIPKVPLPIAYRGSRSSLGEPINYHQSIPSSSPKIEALPPVPDDDDDTNNPTTTPTRKSQDAKSAPPERKSRENMRNVNLAPNKKGKMVLRKKSLTRAHLVTMVDAQ